jgi:hypothetical protein
MRVDISTFVDTPYHIIDASEGKCAICDDTVSGASMVEHQYNKDAHPLCDECYNGGIGDLINDDEA